MKLIFEKGVQGRTTEYLPQLAKDSEFSLPKRFARKEELNLPELSELELSRHYSELERKSFGINNGIYMLGSCTMKYNPHIHELIVRDPQYAGLHPLQDSKTCQGALAVLVLLEQSLKEVCGMDAFSFQAAAGAQAELVGLLLMKAYHREQGQEQRCEILVPDAAHGTNPASASMAGFKVKSIPTHENGQVDLEGLKDLLGDKTAGLMLTNPNTEGKFERQIAQITSLVHEAGGLCYYDGANLNAIMGTVRPGDMGFDIVHLNLHKTFSTPHGGGGPGSGAVGVKAFLKEFLPGRVVRRDGQFLDLEKPEKSIGEVHAFNGNFLVVLRALAYALSLGASGLKEASQIAVLNANYMQHELKDYFDLAQEGLCMHEFVLSLASFKKKTGVSAKDVSKALLDYGMHPPTMYFPLTVPEALMIEPTETEPKDSLDAAINAFKEIYDKALSDPDYLLASPYSCSVKRLDETAAARNPQLRYIPESKTE